MPRAANGRPLTDMRIVLLGASGFLGRYVLRELARAGHQCTVLTRNVARARDLRLVPGVRLVPCNAGDVDALAPHFEGVDAAVSMVGILNERGRSGEGFRHAHVALVESLVTACTRCDVSRVVHVSALGAGQGESHYQRTKGEAERLLADSGLAVTLLRPSVIFGPGDSFFNRFAALLRWMPVMPLACPGARLQPVYAADVAVVLASTLADPDWSGQALELGGPEVYTLKELVQWTARQLDLRRYVHGLSDGLARAQATVMDFVPGKPFSTDNYRSLQTDNTTQANHWPDFGIRPASIGAIVPAYLGQSPHQQRLAAFRGIATRQPD